ncbi:DUF3576 domain-containing protein [Pelagibacteraceae bacterium]|nr:DUF3576 domain-containing protein [Pelagibacteraceae bacterium]
MSIFFLKSKKFIKTTLFPLFLYLSSCSSFDVVQNETDFFESKMEARGNDLDVNSTSLTDRITQMLGGENIDLKTRITFLVALDQFSVIPLQSVDRAGGVIITDWYSTSSNANEKVKFNIIIKDEMMQDDSIDIIMFKQVYNGSTWVSSPASKDIANKIKKLILEKSIRLQATAELS